MHRRGRENFCLQKSRMPLAGLVYIKVEFYNRYLELADLAIDLADLMDPLESVDLSKSLVSI